MRSQESLANEVENLRSEVRRLNAAVTDSLRLCKEAEAERDTLKEERDALMAALVAAQRK